METRNTIFAPFQLGPQTFPAVCPPLTLFSLVAPANFKKGATHVSPNVAAKRFVCMTLACLQLSPPHPLPISVAPPLCLAAGSGQDKAVNFHWWGGGGGDPLNFFLAEKEIASSSKIVQCGSIFVRLCGV